MVNIGSQPEPTVIIETWYLIPANVVQGGCCSVFAPPSCAHNCDIEKLSGQFDAQAVRSEICLLLVRQLRKASAQSRSARFESSSVRF